MDTRHLLIPVDFSDASEKAIESAAGLLSKLGGSATLVHVVGVTSLRVGAGELAQPHPEDAELEALCRANRWFHRGLTPTYQVSCRDASGAELRPWEDGRYDDVAAITLRWRSGHEVDRQLLSTRPLSCVFGE